MTAVIPCPNSKVRLEKANRKLLRGEESRGERNGGAKWGFEKAGGIPYL